MMVADDRCDLSVIVHFRKNPLSDYGVRLHLPALLKSEGTGLLQQPRRKADLSDVMNQAADVNQLNLLGRETHSLGNVTGINGYRGRVPGRVPISRVEGCD
jgi:hypothetical protein